MIMRRSLAVGGCPGASGKALSPTPGPDPETPQGRDQWVRLGKPKGTRTISLVLSNFLIGLREGLEAALVVSILVAYLVKSDRRHLLPRIWLGVGLAVALSRAVPLGARAASPGSLTFEAQELIGGTLSIDRRRLRHLDDLLDGPAPPGHRRRAARPDRRRGRAARWSLVVVALLAVGREGLETARSCGRRPRPPPAATPAREPPPSRCSAPPLGIATAVVLGYLIYRGAIRST